MGQKQRDNKEDKYPKIRQETESKKTRYVKQRLVGKCSSLETDTARPPG